MKVLYYTSSKNSRYCDTSGNITKHRMHLTYLRDERLLLTSSNIYDTTDIYTDGVWLKTAYNTFFTFNYIDTRLLKVPSLRMPDWQGFHCTHKWAKDLQVKSSASRQRVAQLAALVWSHFSLSCSISLAEVCCLNWTKPPVQFNSSNPFLQS